MDIYWLTDRITAMNLSQDSCYTHCMDVCRTTGDIDETMQAGETGPETAGSHYMRKLKGNTRFCNCRAYSPRH